ncbi:ATP-binding cassette domain-containing protein [Lonepinella koalarum]|uniref:ATP-binding cassette domain-containing protein n=1 Tax=Lonepinella koalarum TaxID=53417 RepID=UPI003F6DBBE7
MQHSTLKKIIYQRFSLPVLLWAGVALLETLFYFALINALAQQSGFATVLCLAVICVLFTTLAGRFGYLSGVKLAGDLYQGLEQVLRNAKLSWFSLANQAKASSMAAEKILFLMSLPAHQMQTFVYASLFPILISGGVIYAFGWQIGLLVIVSLIIAFALQLVGQRTLQGLEQQRQQLQQQLDEQSLQFVDNLAFWRSVRGMQHAGAGLNALWYNNATLLTKLNRLASIMISLATLSSLLPMLIVAIGLATNGATPLQILLLVLLVARAAAPFETLAIALLSLPSIKTAFAQYQELLNAPHLKQKDVDGNNISQHNVTPNNDKTAVKNNAVLSICKLHYGVLKNINFQINQGERVQIAGASGCGKSTLLELLLRFDDPEQGQILLNDRDIKTLPYRNFMQQFAYVPQEPVLFAGTLAENLRLGNQASDEQLTEILQSLNLGYLLNREQGLNQQIGRNGEKLSGGERQRLCLARALLKNAPILLLDEVTAPLDDSSETAVLDYIKAQHRTVIFTTHKNDSKWESDKVVGL